MARTLRVATYHADGPDPTLRSALVSIDGLRLIGEWDGSHELVALVRQTRPNVVAVLLNGPSAPRLLDQIAALVREEPGVTVLGIGLPNDPELLRAAMRARLVELIDLPVDPEKLLAALQGV